jgi:hypothetical protein
MQEDFGTIINRGVNSWYRNLNICIPFILNFFINLLLYVFFFGLMGMLLFASNAQEIVDPASMPPEELYSIVLQGFTDNFALSMLLIFGFLLLGMYIQSFFTAGAIGMANRAIETGDTVLTDMLVSGSKNSFRLFLTNLLLSLLLLGGIIFIVPGALQVGDFSGLLENPEAQLEGMGVLVIGILLWAFYMAIISIVLSLAPYALVIDRLDPLEAMKTGFAFFKENKLDVFFIWVIYIGLALVNNFVGEFIGSRSLLVAGITSIIPIFVLQPLIAVLWTRLYMSKKGKKLYNPSDLLSVPNRV